MTKTVIFDLDCLIDTTDWEWYAFNRALESKIQHYIPEEERYKYEDLSFQGKADCFGLGGNMDFRKLVQLKRIEIIGERTKFDPTKYLMIQELWAHDIRIGCISDDPNADLIIKKMGLDQYMDWPTNKCEESIEEEAFIVEGKLPSEVDLMLMDEYGIL